VSDSESPEIGCLTTVAPGADSDVYPIFNSAANFNGLSLRGERVSRVQFAVEHSHAATLRAYMSTNGGTNWDQVEEDEVVGVPAAGDIGGPWSFLVDTYRDFKLDWVNGGSAQTSWRPTVTLIIGDHASAT